MGSGFASFFNRVAGTQINELIVPDTTNEKELCVDAFLGEDLDSNEKATESRVGYLYDKVTSVFQSLHQAKKVHIDRSYDEQMILDIKCNSLEQVCCSSSFMV